MSSVVEIQMKPEDPLTTVIRLINRNLRVVKEDGSLAHVHISREWYDRELFRNHDAQVTVGLAESREERLEMSARLRRRNMVFRLNVWASDKPEPSDPGRLLRGKIVEEIYRIIRQNRNLPNKIRYNFAGLGYPEGDPHKAFSAGAASELVPRDPGWAELRESQSQGYDEYQRIWYSDDWRYSKGYTAVSGYAMMLFRFKVDCSEKCIKQLRFVFEGYGVAPGGNGVAAKVWNHVAQEWQHIVINSADEDEELVLELGLTEDRDLSDYVDDDGHVWLLVRTAFPSNGSGPAELYCDYACLWTFVKGISFLDIISSRDADRVDVKPFIYRTEFTLRGWLFEDVGGAF